MSSTYNTCYVDQKKQEFLSNIAENALPNAIRKRGCLVLLGSNGQISEESFWSFCDAIIELQVKRTVS